MLTILGMGVGIAAILFLVGLGFGIQKTLLETITTADSLLSLDVYPIKGDETITLDQISQIKQIKGIKLVSPIMEATEQIKYADLRSEAKISAVDENFLKLDGLKIIKGQDIIDTDLGGIVISSSLAKIFDKTPESLLGEYIKIFFSKKGYGLKEDAEVNFKVIGLVDKKEIVIYLNQKALAGLSPLDNFSRLKIKCVSGQAMESTRNELAAKGFIVSALTDTIRQVEKTFAIIRVILGFFGAIALIVSAIGMFNTMVVTLLERTEEIGIMKSIGASNYDILWMFVFESTIMGFLGGLVGIIMGFLGGTIFNLIFNFIAQKFGGSAISLFYFPAWFLMFILAAAVFVGFITGLIPARKASATDPLVALRYK